VYLGQKVRKEFLFEGKKDLHEKSNSLNFIDSENKYFVIRKYLLVSLKCCEDCIQRQALFAAQTFKPRGSFPLYSRSNCNEYIKASLACFSSHHRYRIPAQTTLFTVFIKHRESHLCDMTFNVIHQVPFTDMRDLATFQLCKLSGASRSRLALSVCLTAAGCQKTNQIIKSGRANARMKPFKCATPNCSRYGSVLV
jgi:hypothetical protein